MITKKKTNDDLEILNEEDTCSKWMGTFLFYCNLQVQINLL